jgi:chromate transporter
LRASPAAGAFLDGVNVASVTLIAVVALKLGRTLLVDALSIAIALASFFAVLRYRVNSAWLITASAAVGVIAYAVSKSVGAP